MRDRTFLSDFLQPELTPAVAHYRHGEFIYVPGDPSDAVYLIREGRVRLSFIDEQGERQTLAILSQGEFFGNLILEGFAPQEFIAEAITETTLCVIDKWKLPQIIRHEPRLAEQLSELLGYKKDLLFLYQR